MGVLQHGEKVGVRSETPVQRIVDGGLGPVDLVAPDVFFRVEEQSLCMPVGVSCVRWVYKKEEGRKEKGWIDGPSFVGPCCFQVQTATREVRRPNLVSCLKWRFQIRTPAQARVLTPDVS